MRLNRINEDDKTSIKNIAKNNDLSMNLFLSKQIRKITESYPNDIKTVKSKRKCISIRVESVSPTIAQQFETIAHNKGLTTSQLLTLHLSDIVSSFPDWMVRFEE